MIKQKHPRFEYNQTYYEKNKSKIKAYQKERRRQHRVDLRDYLRVWRRTHPDRHLFCAAKHRAKKNGLEFNIELEDIIIPKYCPFLGVELTPSDKKLKPTSATLDRINSTQGYIKGNIEVISHLANTMKSNATKEQLITFANSIRSRYESKDVGRTG